MSSRRSASRGLGSDAVAVIDIGSNSARLVIYHPELCGQLRILGSARQSLQLVRDVDRDRRLSEDALALTLRTLSDFRSIIKAYAARPVIAVATAAVRDADNGSELISRARSELGIRIELIDAAREGYLGALGGIRALAVDHGIAFDLGGGSVQVIQFRDRRPGSSASLPLGSLRLSQAFIFHDPPTKKEVRNLRNYIQRILSESKTPRLRSGEALVGIGGTVRNLAKVDARLQGYPIARIHGYRITAERLAEIVGLLCRKPIRSAKSISGLSREREDSIVGGAIAIQELVQAVGASEILVSGQGVREGLVYSLTQEVLPPTRSVRDGAVISLARRFSTWDEAWAERRKEIVGRLIAALAARAHPEVTAALAQAAIILDIGRSVDFFDRYAHAAAMVMDTELDGFSHLQISLLAAIIAAAGDEHARLPFHSALLQQLEEEEIKRAAVLLRLSDDILQRLPRRGAVEMRCRAGRKEVQISGNGLDCWTPRGTGSRFERVFGRRLVILPHGAKGSRATLKSGRKS